jgi:transposase
MRQIAEKLNQGRFPLRAEKTNINDELANMFIRSGRPILTPRLMEKQKNYREIFAAAIQTDVRISFPWMFSDRTMITRNNHNYYVRTIRTLVRPDESYARTEQYPIQVMVWGSIARDFKSSLMRVDEHLNADQYVAMIAASGVIELMNARHGQTGWVFQHDLASPHRGKITRQFVEPLCLTLLSEFHWPANSPDLNVIENLWAILKRRMATQDSETADGRWEQVRTAWDNITFDEINHLVDSFDSRLQGVMVLHGESLNGQGSVCQRLADGYTLEQISALRIEEEAIMGRFIRDSAIFFAARGWNHPSCTDVIRESGPIVQ